MNLFACQQASCIFYSIVQHTARSFPSTNEALDPQSTSGCR